MAVKVKYAVNHPALGQGGRSENHRLKDGKFLTPYLLGWKGRQSGHNKRQQKAFEEGYDRIDWSKG